MNEDIKKFASRYAAKKLGQHFLIDKEVLSDIVEAADIKKEETILEVGPGVGVLTAELLKRAKKVVAVEKDKRLIPYLRELFKNSDLSLYQEDILKFNVEDKIKGNYKLVANIPYYLTSKLIRTFLEKENKPTSMILMIQKEVAERIIARSPKSNLLAISVQFYARPEIVSLVSSKSFYPEPKVESAIIKISDIKNDSNVDTKKFFRLVKIGFSSPRKKLLNNLSGGLGLSKNETEEILQKIKIAKNIRAEVLEIEDWKNLNDQVEDK